VTSASQFVGNWEYLRSVLGSERFLRHARQLLDKDPSREKILAAIQEPQRGLDALDAATIGETAASYIGDVEQAAANLVQETSQDDWSTALQSPQTTSLLALALRVVDGAAESGNPSGLQQALHEHFQTLVVGNEAWAPPGAEFAKLTMLLSAPARHVLASQLCAELEGSDGQVGSALLLTYGDFLGAESAFRTHSKLPNVIERLVARDQWTDVGWFVDLAKREPDALDEKGRADEMAHLRESVGEKVRTLGSEAPEELKQLAGLFGIQTDSPDLEPESEE
jgi:hypothetical protein